jgi:class 3 adenylate cyclase
MARRGLAPPGGFEGTCEAGGRWIGRGVGRSKGKARMLRPAFVRFGFRFPDDARERLFVERFVLVHLRTSQLFLVATGLLFALFHFWDRAIDPAGARQVFALREFALSPMLLAAAAALFVRRLQPRLETIICLAMTMCLASFIYICTQLEHGFQYGTAGLLLIYFGGASMFPLRIGFLVLPSLVSIVGFLGLQVLDGRTASDMMIVNGLSIGTAVLIAALSTIGRETAARREFQTDLALDLARARVDDLLHSMMPREIVGRIHAGETTIADIHTEVSIVFADLVGFTALSRTLSASQLVHLLNTVFSRFDAAAGRLGIEKIKTIGDAYMAVGGLSSGDEATEHAERMADFALEMRDITAAIATETGLAVQIRIGLHVGPVVAGVIGLKKPAFDCWGDAVNMASRLEHASGPGAVLISESACLRLRHRFRVEPAPEVNLKGIGVSKVFLLHDRMAADAEAA